MTPNRIVAIATAVLSLALAVLPVVGNFDWTSTAGVIAGLVAVAGIALKWLDGWQKHETAVANARLLVEMDNPYAKAEDPRDVILDPKSDTLPS